MNENAPVTTTAATLILTGQGLLIKIPSLESSQSWDILLHIQLLSFNNGVVIRFLALSWAYKGFAAETHGSQSFWAKNFPDFSLTLGRQKNYPNQK